MKFAVLIYNEILMETEDLDEASVFYNACLMKDIVENLNRNTRLIRFEDVQPSKQKNNNFTLQKGCN